MYRHKSANLWLLAYHSGQGLPSGISACMLRVIPFLAWGWCQTLFLVLTCCLLNQKQSLTPDEKTGAGPACTRCRPTLRARSGWTRDRRLGAPAGWRTSTPRCLTMMLPEYANPYDETARWAIPPGRWRLPGPWAWNTASAHPAARPGVQWSDQDPREQSAAGTPMRKDRAIQDPEARLPISPIAPQKLPVSRMSFPYAQVLVEKHVTISRILHLFILTQTWMAGKPRNSQETTYDLLMHICAL